jgi:DNA-binding MarR family transcriptional regulator
MYGRYAAPPRHRPGSASEVFTELVLEIFRTNGRLLATGDRLAMPVGLTSARWQVLGAIDGGPLSVAQIARDMGLTRQSVQRLANVLAAEGIVSFAGNPAHKRAKLVQLTPRGRAMLDRISCIQVDWARQMADGFARGELQSALTTLRSIRQRLEQAAAAGGETDECQGS